MDQKDEKWIEDNMDDPIVEGNGDFEGTVFLSTDNKMTVSIKSTSKEGRRDGLKWAKAVYSRLMYTYGAKQTVAAQRYKNVDNGIDVNAPGYCEIHKIMMKQYSKNGRTWYAHLIGDVWCNGK